MKPRKEEALRLEQSYLERLRVTLDKGDPLDADEIWQNVASHIEEAINEFETSEVTLVQMAEVLERLGPPEALGTEENSHQQEDKGSSRPDTTPLPETDHSSFIEFIDKIWIGYLVGVIGLFIPIIDFNFCEMISLLSKIIFKKPYEKTSESGRMGCDKQSCGVETPRLPEHGGYNYESYSKYFYTDSWTCQQKFF